MFQSTPPARGATNRPSDNELIMEFQSTPPARGATESNRQPSIGCLVSIHAPRAGGDAQSIHRKRLL